jgi:hypothetical protein
MDYFKLVAGLLLLIAFGWVMLRNGKRTGFLHAFFAFDILLGLMAGLYLVITSVASIL